MTHSMMLNMLQREADPFETVMLFLTANHEPPIKQRALKRKAIGIYRELLNGGVVERLPEPDEFGRTVRLTVSLQENFALNQPLSPFALASLSLLDKESESYALDAVSVIESTLEKPRQVLIGQEKKAKSEALAEMKAEGLDYNERMAELDKITYPQPLADLLEQAFETYSAGAPFMKEFEVEPKSVVRDMYERAMGFGDYIQFYGLERSEGILLRYLSDAYKALRQTVPLSALTDELTDVIEWLGEVIRQTDSSLVDEWERLAAGEEGIPVQDSLEELVAESAPKVTSNVRAFKVMVRNAMFRRVELFADERDHLLGELDGERSGWDADRWAEAMDDYFEEYEDIYTDAEARSPRLIEIDDDTAEHPGVWKVRQIFADPDDNHDFGIVARVDLDASDKEGAPVVLIESVGAF